MHLVNHYRNMMELLRKIVILYLISLAVGASAQTVGDSLTISSALWDKQKVTKGVTALHAQFPMLYGGAQDVYMVEIKGRKKFEVLDHNGRALTSRKAQDSKALAAVNGTYFDMGETGRSVCFVAKNGRVIEYTHKSLGQLTNGAVVMKGRKVEIMPWDVSIERQLFPDSTGIAAFAKEDVMVAGPLLLQNGREESFYNESHVMGKHPRSVIAVKGGKVYFIVVDGRDAERAIGVTIPELAHMMRVLKMDSALNLDGGGSSTLWVRPQIQYYNDGTPVCPCNGILNEPSGGDERAVSNSILALPSHKVYE